MMNSLFDYLTSFFLKIIKKSVNKIDRIFNISF